MSCLLIPLVIGYSRVPLPPANTIPFIMLSIDLFFVKYLVWISILIFRYNPNKNQAVFEVKTSGFWVVIKRVFTDYPSEWFYAFMLQDIISKGDFFFLEKIKKIINLYIFVFYFYFFWKKEFDLFYCNPATRLYIVT